MNTILGIAMLLFSGILILKYRPKQKENRILCGMAALMGLVALLTGNQMAVWMQVIQITMLVLVAAVCVIRLHAEKVVRSRRRKARHTLRQVPVRAVPEMGRCA